MTRKEIRVGVVGVGNCCSALVQGLTYYRKAGKGGISEGLTFVNVGGYLPGDIKIVTAFDVDRRKVGRDLGEAIFAEPNSCIRVCDVGVLGTKVLKGPVLDGVAPDMRDHVLVDDSAAVDVAATLRDAEAEVLVNLLPVGAKKASRLYANEALKAHCAYVNCTPAQIATDKALATKFSRARSPLVGDDLMSQIGGTVFHKSLLEFLHRRGVKVKNSYQLDVGGGTESRATIEESKKMLKQKIKTSLIRSALPYKFEVVSGTTDYVEFLGNQRVSYYWLSGGYFLGAPILLDIYLRTMDGPNSGAVIFDVVRACKLALERKIGGPLNSICVYGFKNPPEKVSLDQAKQRFIEFVEGKKEK